MNSGATRRKGARARHSLMLFVCGVLLAALWGPASASAAPKGEYAVFSDCPLTTAFQCLYAKTESGSITVGGTTVPVEKPIVLQGGFTQDESGDHFIAAKDGNTLTKAAQKVPGGLAGFVKCNEISNSIERAACELVFENGVTGVTATTELAGPASSIGLNEENFIEGTGTALSLPVKVHLENPLLGSSCYVGSNSSPIVINLTTGTSGSLKGTPGELEFLGEGGIIAFSKNKLVNATFSAPTASGCGGLFAFLIDPLVNSKLGLPSGSGHNAATLNGKLEQAAVETVKEHE